MKMKVFSFTGALVKCKVAMGVLAGILACGQVGAQDSISGDDVVRRVSEDILYKEEAVRNVEKAGGKLITHTVDRGESLESIAKAYDVPIDFLKLLNPEAKECYAGTTLNIPQLPKSNPEASRKTADNNDEAQKHVRGQLAMKYDNAARRFRAGEYGKAVKIYNSIIKDDASAAAYFNRGLAQFNREKWRQAAEDFDAARLNREATSEMKSKCTELAGVARKNHEAWVKKRNNIIAGVIGGVLVAGATTYAAVEMSKSNRNSNSLYTPSYGYPSAGASRSVGTGPVANQIMAKTIRDVSAQNMSYNATFNSLMNQTMQQVQMEKQTFISNFKASNPYASDFDAEQAYTNYLSAKYGGYNGGSYESGDNGSGLTTLDEYKKRKQDNLNMAAGEYCLSCHGYKKCSACGGTKVVHKGGMTYTCTLCNDAGDCPVCHGTGLASWNR